MKTNTSRPLFNRPFRRPDAWAVIHGNYDHPELEGIIRFYDIGGTTLVSADIRGLPQRAHPCKNAFFGFHIHSGGHCTGTETEPFSDSGMHYNPQGNEHPCHSGDMPPLLNADGVAFLSFITNSFTAEEIIGKTVIIHSSPDDFTTQPSGNSGTKIACGEIVRRGDKSVVYPLF